MSVYMTPLTFFFNCLLYYTDRFHVAGSLFSNGSQKTSKCGKDISNTLSYRFPMSCLFFLPHFDVICGVPLPKQTHSMQHGIYLIKLIWFSGNHFVAHFILERSSLIIKIIQTGFEAPCSDIMRLTCKDS